MSAYRSPGMTPPPDPPPPPPDFSREYYVKLARAGARNERLKGLRGPAVGVLMILVAVLLVVALWKWEDEQYTKGEADCAKRGGVYLRRDQACVAPPPSGGAP